MTLRMILTIGISIFLLMTTSCEWESYVEPPERVERIPTLTVPGQYETIQAAIDASIDGDEIIVASGTYTGTGNRDIRFDGKAITLRSEKGPDSTIINCQGSAASPRRAFIFMDGEDNTSVVRGFRILQGFADDESLRGPWGGAVYVENAAPKFINCVFDRNDADYGGAVACRTSSPAFDSCTFVDNDALDGGCLKAEGGAEPKLWNCSIVDNYAAARGGAIDCTNAAPTCTNTVFIGNSANSPGLGGAIFCNSSSPLLRSCIFFDNSSVDGAGIHCVDGSNPTIEYCSFVKNRVSGESAGAGLSSNIGSAPFVNYCLFANNTTGRAVFAQDTLTVPTLKCCNIFNNPDGDWVGPIAPQASLRGNFSADPLFCDDPISEELRLTSESPCLPENNNCSKQVGAFVEVCGAR